MSDDETPMVGPMIHLNGTPAATLLRGLEAAEKAVSTAIELTKRTAPHGRDYYTLSGDAFDLAREQHEMRLLVLMKVQEELLLLTNHILKQETKRIHPHMETRQ